MRIIRIKKEVIENLRNKKKAEKSKSKIGKLDKLIFNLEDEIFRPDLPI